MYDTFTLIRHIFELLVAAFIFLIPSARRRRYFFHTAVIGAVALILISVSLSKLFEYILLTFSEQLLRPSPSAINGITLLNCFFYIITDVLLLIIYLYFCFDMKPEQMLFILLGIHAVFLIKGIIVYFIEFSLIGNVSELNFWTQVIYNAVRIILVTLFYFLAYFILGRRWHPQDEYIILNKRLSVFIYFFFIVLLFATNMMATSQLYAMKDNTKYSGITIELFLGIFTLLVLYSIHSVNAQRLEKEVIRQVLNDRGKQYEISKENIDIINRKYHDLKHQIAALKHMDAAERNATYNEMEKMLSIYDTMANSGNEIIDTILTEKKLLCQERGIELKHNVNAENLGFINTVDLYTLLGNALDNAMEAVGKIEDPSERYIDFTIKNSEIMTIIQTKNFIPQEIKSDDGLPQTTKEDKQYHGFGLKSIKEIVERYGGIMTINTDNKIFTLSIGIPRKKTQYRRLKIRLLSRTDLLLANQ